MRYFLESDAWPKPWPWTWLRCVLYFGHSWQGFAVVGLGPEGEGECCRRCHIIKIEHSRDAKSV